MSILVLDLGTTNFKASIFDASGAMIELSRFSTPIANGSDARCEIAPDAFRAAVANLIRQLDEQTPGAIAEVRAISFATQTNSFVLLDEHNEPLTPIILWPDNRATESASEVTRLTALPSFCDTTGVPDLSHQFMVAKLAWLHAHEPNIVKKTARLCLISDYLTIWFTGQHATEAGTAGLTGLLDIHAVDWWDESCAAGDVPIGWLPRVVRAGTDLGPISPTVANELGLPPATRFIVGCLDQYAGAIGVGNVIPDGISETTGTVLATVKCADAFDANASDDVFQGPAFVPGYYYRMDFGDTSANWLEEYQRTQSDRPSFADLDEEAANVAIGADGLTHLLLEDPESRAAILAEWTQSHSRGHAVRAILETVAFALADQVARLCGQNVPARIACAGGAARSSLWLQIKADILNCTMLAAACPEPTSLGAAILAMHALTGEPVPQIAASWVQPARTVAPDAARHAEYRSMRRLSSEH
jgi:xylulokinase